MYFHVKRKKGRKKMNKQKIARAFLREWTTEGTHGGNTSLTIVKFKNKGELLKEKKQLEKFHPTIILRYFEIKEENYKLKK